MPVSPDDARGALALFVDVLAELVADRLQARLVLGPESAAASPWLTTKRAIAYCGLPEGTFRKLAACGKIPSHGGRAKLFYRPEIDAALLGFSGLEGETRELRRVG